MTRRRLEILSIASVYPSPLIGGTQMLVFQQLADMSRHHDVDLVVVGCGGDGGFPSGLPDCRSIDAVRIPKPERPFADISRHLLFCG